MKKVFVAMSGGVDSSVAAALLKTEGYEVVGVFIRGWEPPQFITATLNQNQIACNWREERRSALSAAARLGIPLLTCDASEDYRSQIIEPMIADYRAGRTPNPDVLCNRIIKFDFLWRFAKDHGADMLATGHYATIRCGSTVSTPGRRWEVVVTAPPQLLMSLDKNKDQTYFLWTLTKTDLTHSLFPIGNYHKSQVRTLAKRFHLTNAEKPDSQGLCFVGQLDFKAFLRTYLPIKLGSVCNETGEKIGEHDGVHFYTIGERHGFRVTTQTPEPLPLYVIAKNVEKNVLTVSPQPLQSAETKKEIMLDQANWISAVPPQPHEKLKARIRYRAPLVDCQISNLANNRVTVTFTRPLFGATPGQSCVFYNFHDITSLTVEPVCLGGGVIC